MVDDNIFMAARVLTVFLKVGHPPIPRETNVVEPRIFLRRFVLLSTGNLTLLADDTREI